MKIDHASYLAAMFDGEGHVANPELLNAKGNRPRAAGITNTDRDLIDACARACEDLGITYRIHRKRPKNVTWKECWTLNIHGQENFEKLLMLPFQSAEKRRKLEIVVATNSRIPPDRDQLERLYVGERLSAKLVAERLSMPPSKVIYWLKKYGLTRSNSESKKLAWAEGRLRGRWAA